MGIAQPFFEIESSFLVYCSTARSCKWSKNIFFEILIFKPIFMKFGILQFFIFLQLNSGHTNGARKIKFGIWVHLRYSKKVLFQIFEFFIFGKIMPIFEFFAI